MGKEEVTYSGMQIFFDHDFTFKVRQQRALYRPIRDQLSDQNIKSHILAPAKLKVFSEGGTTQTYGNPKAAGKALVERGLVCPHRVTKIPGAWNGTPGSDNDGKWIINNGAVGALLNWYRRQRRTLAYVSENSMQITVETGILFQNCG